ncbi:MAG: DUF2752 domain-containing protein [bacterium]|nr:DUF2752 domain-containing protein [bacterium]
MRDKTAYSPRKSNAIVMLICAIVFILGARFILSDPHSPSPLHFRVPIIGDISTPHCPSKMLTGVPCPVCGITRSVANVVRGRIIEGFRYHPLGPFLVFMVLISIPASVWILVTPDIAETEFQRERNRYLSKMLTWITVALIILAWLVTLARHFNFIGW